MLNVNEITQIYLGVQGENAAQTITIDVSPWLVAYPDGSVTIWHRRNGDSVPAATGAAFDSDAGTISWTPSGADTYVAGEGEAEIRLTVGAVIKKSRPVKTCVSPAVTLAGQAVGSGWQNYINAVDQMRAAAVAAANQAEEMNGHPPYINVDTLNWMTWDSVAGEYTDSGSSSQGLRGAQGPQGLQGETGPRGDAFSIKKVYASIAAMEADYSGTDVDVGEYVIVSTSSGDEDNGKVYVKGSAAWVFIVQMAGVEGPEGPQGETGSQGVPGPQGDPFYIKKIYGSVAAMEADYSGTDVDVGEFVIIRTTAEDTDNGKLYVKGEEDWEFIVQVAGLPGPQGEQGAQGIAGPGVKSGGTEGQFLVKNSATNYDTKWITIYSSLIRMSDQDSTSVYQELAKKAGKVTGATSGNFAALDGNGNLTDSGSKAGDFLTAHQDISGKVNVTDFFASVMTMSAQDVRTVAEAIGNMILTADDEISIPASGSSVTMTLPGLTAAHELIRWNFSDSAENNPPCSLTWLTDTNSFTITNTGGTTSETITPVFAIPTAKTATAAT